MIRDISVALHPKLPTFPGDPGFKRWLACDMSKGGKTNNSHLDFGAHSGTHVDAPLHMIEGGADVTSFALDSLVGEAHVIEISDKHSIKLAEIRGAGIAERSRVLFKTANSALWKRGEFEKNFVHLELDAARFLADLGTKLVGIDYLSVEKFGSAEFPVHQTLMRESTVILEGVDLSAIRPGKYRLFCGPIKIVGADGAPARVFLED